MNSGIQPTVELATNNGSYPYPFYPMMGGNGGFGGYGADWIWIIVLFALFGGWGNNNNGGFFGGNNFDDGYAWLSNGQKEIMQNTNNGFDTLHLSNQLEGTRNSIDSLSKQVCDGFYGVEISANNRQIADMQQNYNNAITNLQSFNSLQKSLDTCCCENRLATCQTQNIVQNEGNATRFADANNTRDIITNATANTQAILDKLCQLELDQKTSKIADLQREVLMKDLQASQVQQTTDIVNSTYARLRDCPIESTPIYGRIPIFTCSQNGVGCGCNNGYNNFI
jgi:hypothetical protein